jgi:FAD/FMN-containing dehydrogenase
VQGSYNGPAAHVSTGLEAWELYKYMKSFNMSIVVPAGSMTVAPWGGWMQGGGHSILASKYGLGADQVLSLQVVIADGSFVTANTETNQDLFFALRGGGPSKF